MKIHKKFQFNKFERKLAISFPIKKENINNIKSLYQFLLENESTLILTDTDKIQYMLVFIFWLTRWPQLWEEVLHAINSFHISTKDVLQKKKKESSMIWIKTNCFSSVIRGLSKFKLIIVKRGFTKYFYSICRYVSGELILLGKKFLL